MGDSIDWTNQDPVAHTTTSGTMGTFNGIGWDSGLMSQGQTFRHTFGVAGTFAYTCTIHSGMNGTITVTP
ncbi:MAG: plastocyanin/azurin family copper-binding protein [Chloroflexi bacterium]|nr:plastocyanin/azurin family copper-binding protein [Chloroflexota bacterium]